MTNRILFLVLSSFIHTFDYTILMLNNRKTSFGLIGAVFFMSGYAIFQYCIILQVLYNFA